MSKNINTTLPIALPLQWIVIVLGGIFIATQAIHMIQLVLFVYPGGEGLRLSQFLFVALTTTLLPLLLAVLAYCLIPQSTRLMRWFEAMLYMTIFFAANIWLETLFTAYFQQFLPYGDNAYSPWQQIIPFVLTLITASSLLAWRRQASGVRKLAKSGLSGSAQRFIVAGLITLFVLTLVLALSFFWMTDISSAEPYSPLLGLSALTSLGLLTYGTTSRTRPPAQRLSLSAVYTTVYLLFSFVLIGLIAYLPMVSSSAMLVFSDYISLIFFGSFGAFCIGLLVWHKSKKYL